MPPTTRSHVLTGQHAVQLAEGTVLRFFLARGDEVGGPGEWGAVTDAEFQYAYEIALFDPAGIAVGELRPNARRVQVPLDSVVGVGGFLWADGCDGATGSTGVANPAGTGAPASTDEPTSTANLTRPAGATSPTASAGVMTTNGKTPQDCGLLLAEFLVETGGAA